MEPLDKPERNESIERFAHDMAKARGRCGISLDDLHESTKIAIGILQEFEQTGLVDNTLFNSVYLRSFISTYAGTIGLDREIALNALESALRGNYGGELSDGAPWHSNRKPADIRPNETTQDLEPDTADSKPKTRDAGETGPPHASSPRERRHDGAVDNPIPAAPGAPRRRFYKPGVAHRFQFEPIRPEKPRRARDGQAETSTPTKAEISTAIRDYREPTPTRGVIIPPNRVKTVVFIVMAVAVTISAAILAFKISSSVPDPTNAGASPAGSQSESRPETAQVRPLEQGLRPLPPIVLGDTVSVTLIASGGPLDPIRVRADRDLRRPFWINMNDSLVFRIANQIVLDSLLERAIVKVEGVRYWPIPGRSQTRLVITRDSVQRFAGTLRTR